MKNNIDSIITVIFLKKIITPFTNTKAFKLKLIDSKGKIIKVPESDEEKDALTILDRLVFKLKRIMGSKIVMLNRFMYLKTLNTNMYDKLTVKGNIEQRAEILRLKKDIDHLQEKYSLSFEEISTIILNEELKEVNL